MTGLTELMAQAAQHMRVSLEETRIALSHSLSKGEALEDAVRKFLRKHLPDSIGIAKGQLIDSKGAHSPQLDVILYDAARTPLLFSSGQDGIQLVPSEGAIAAIEVKTHLGPSDVEQLVKHMSGVKSLDKSAYHPAGLVSTTYNLYGKTLDIAPTCYFALTLECSNPGGIAAALAERQAELPLERRVDSLCSLDGYALMNAKGVPLESFDAIPRPDSILSSYPTENALLLWYLGIVSYTSQVQHRPIDLHRYLPPGPV
ncbi:DUF6602 domain-containing protein [Kribbella sp. NPDC051620]|uniref:DUF6602 domain-containing protein n=1 Tax=Kribbella sp. NPDC051620 TaxID=3364120 RepID=UPI0037994450